MLPHTKHECVPPSQYTRMIKKSEEKTLRIHCIAYVQGTFKPNIIGQGVHKLALTVRQTY